MYEYWGDYLLSPKNDGERNTREYVRFISEIVRTPRERLIEMGENGKRLIRDNYSVDVLGRKMLSLYKWLVGEGDKPDFVYGI